MIVTLTFDTSDVDQNNALKRAMAADALTSALYNIKEAAHYGLEYDKTLREVSDMIMILDNDVEAALDTWV